MAMIAITTKSSMSVNPEGRFDRFMMDLLDKSNEGIWAGTKLDGSACEPSVLGEKRAAEARVSATRPSSLTRLGRVGQ
jgi:hypothetical protein